MTDGVEIDERDVKAGKYREYWVTREPSMNPSGWTYRAFTYKPTLVRGMEFVNNSTSTNPVVQNALAAKACNGQHFHGGGDALAEKIARAVQKYADANGGAKGKYLDEITTLSRTASSLAGGAWVMRDGSVALTDKQPRGATRLMDFVKTLNSAVAANADTEASIEAEAKKLYAQLREIAKKFDALTKRLRAIKVYWDDYSATASGIRDLHGING